MPLAIDTSHVRHDARFTLAALDTLRPHLATYGLEGASVVVLDYNGQVVRAKYTTDAGSKLGFVHFRQLAGAAPWWVYQDDRWSPA